MRLGEGAFGPSLGDHDVYEENRVRLKLEKEKRRMVRCKFSCSQKDELYKMVRFAPVYTGSEENKRFFAATPNGYLELGQLQPEAMAAFEPGQEYYIDIKRATESALGPAEG